ncbi:hypothetical protein SCHPADRAFT_928617 [Schizopora paradoxa]|uniref:Uncharacterized protein n=1 Tax=Schizopora paradoxa TaxID=27342 RepID=A0A0H2RV48_9AGAM|nr:hypothetical protein SCHPADRAFT_928617 [Schizopora paradoxa]
MRVWKRLSIFSKSRKEGRVLDLGGSTCDSGGTRQSCLRLTVPSTIPQEPSLTYEPTITRGLPEEILQLILEALVRLNPNARLSRKRSRAEAVLRLNSLRKAALVCKSWYIAATPLLYTHCTVTSPISLELLWRTIKSSPKEMKSFTYAPLRSKDVENKTKLAIQLCRALPRETAITITVFTVSLNPQHIRDIAGSLTCLHLNDYQSNSFDRTTFRMPVHLPRLICLIMESFLFGDEFGWPITPALEELCFHSCLFLGNNDAELLSPFKTIKKLELRQTDSRRYYPIHEEEALSSLFVACASSLEHLSVVVRAGERPYPVWKYVHLLTGLLSFSYGYEVYESVYDAHDPLEQVDQIFCIELIPGIQRDTFAPTLHTNLAYHTLKHFLDRYVSTMGIKAIRLFGFKSLFGESDALRRRCDDYGVELDCSGCVFERGQFAL